MSEAKTFMAPVFPGITDAEIYMEFNAPYSEALDTIRNRGRLETPVVFFGNLLA